MEIHNLDPLLGPKIESMEFQYLEPCHRDFEVEKKREYDFSRLVTRRPDHKSALSIYHVLAISEYL